jgi:hypothetical protein
MLAIMHCLSDMLLILYAIGEHLCTNKAYKINNVSLNLCVRGVYEAS